MKTMFYGLCSRQSGLLSNIFLSVDDKEAAKWLLDTLIHAYDEIHDVEEKARFLVYVQDCDIVKIGDLDVITHEMTSDFNVLVTLRDFKKEVEKDNGTA